MLDICCGTGTIGIFCHKIAKHVVGIDMSFDSIRMANFNKELNKIQNIEFIQSKIEACLSVIKEKSNGKILGIIDPPRCGLHPNVIKTIRKIKGLDFLLYVSCN